MYKHFWIISLFAICWAFVQHPAPRRIVMERGNVVHRMTRQEIKEHRDKGWTFWEVKK